MMTRRHSLGLLAAFILPARYTMAAEVAGRRLDFEIGPDFGNARPVDIKAVLLSAADSIWSHCPDTRWETPGFYIYHNQDVPINDFRHRADGRIAIGLTSQGNLWAQFAYQFSHEFCHALAGHTNNWKDKWIRGRKANHWLEESICETASLFAIRAMAKSWQTKPPYPNWKDYSEALARYASDMLDNPARRLPEGKSFVDWQREHEPAMRENSNLREKNNIVAVHLLPLFEFNPSGWEAVTFHNLGQRDPEKTLAAHFTDWQAAAPEAHRKFIREMAALFGVELR
jgi:hypothetical protein